MGRSGYGIVGQFQPRQALHSSVSTIFDTIDAEDAQERLTCDTVAHGRRPCDLEARNLELDHFSYFPLIGEAPDSGLEEPPETVLVEVLYAPTQRNPAQQTCPPFVEVPRDYDTAILAAELGSWGLHGSFYQCGSHDAIFYQENAESAEHCIIYCHADPMTPNGTGELQAFLDSKHLKLFTDTHLFDLPDFIQDQIAKCRHRHKPPLWVDSSGISDSWCFAVFVEQYVEDNDNGDPWLEFLGLTCQQVLNEPDRPHHTGTTHIGSDAAETEGLLWSALWRLAQNDRLPTTFVCDSQLVGQQATGMIGSTLAEKPYRHLQLHSKRWRRVCPENIFVLRTPEAMQAIL
eukprot:s676_g12.t1